jgi:maleate isomerase
VVTVLNRPLRFGVIVPSTNTVVEDEFNYIRPRGVSYHSGRILIRNEQLDSDEAMENFLKDLRSEIAASIASVRTCHPDYLGMGMSAETFWGGVDGNAQFIEFVREHSGLGVSTGASACREALAQYPSVKRLGVITPYQAVGDDQVRTFFGQLGYEIVNLYGMKCPTATAIADVPPEEVEAAFRSVDGPEIDALVQAGTNLAAIPTAAALEQELGKPVLAINLVTLWHALRRNGIDDQIAGFGSLLAEH